MSVLYYLLGAPIPVPVVRPNAVDWTSLKDGIYAWLVSSSKLAPERVMFGGQNLNRPKGIDSAWISVWIMGDEKTGDSFVRYIDNPAPTPGAELIKQIVGQSRVTMQITCYGARGAKDETEAYVIMSDVIADTEVTEVTDLLVEAGVSFQDFSPVITVGGTINTTRIEPRAQVTVTFLTPTLRERTMTFIETVNVEVQVTAPSPVKVFDYTFNLGG